MAENDLHLIEIKDDFYRDGFGKIIFIIVSLSIVLALLGALSFYIHITKPKPVTFAVDNEWRVQPAIPIDQPYLSTPEVLQWVSNVVPSVFYFDFHNYDQQLKTAMQYFTEDGWKVFLNQLNIYVNYTKVQQGSLFVSAKPAGAPYIVNQGILASKYAWWVQMPIMISYEGGVQTSQQMLTLQVLVVRIPTLNNLSGVAIDNVIVSNGAENSQPGRE